MKATTMIVLGGLLFAGTSLAAEPQQATTPTPDAHAGSGSKVGIDARTGKLRPLTAAESAQLDAIAAKNKAALAKTKGKTAAKASPTVVVVNGRSIILAGESEMVETRATIGKDGKVIISHDSHSNSDPQGDAHE